jgi:hypothetical protein
MDEISSSDEVKISVGIEDNNPLYELIGGFIEEAFGEVARIAPVHILSLSATTPATTSSDGVAVIEIPGDYLRFAFITGSVFKRTIGTLNMEGDSVAIRQDNTYTRAGNAKPVAVYSGTVGHPAIRVYCSSGTATMYYVAKSTHITSDATPNVTYSTDAENEIAKWVTAEKVFSAMGDAPRAQICRARIEALIQ